LRYFGDALAVLGDEDDVVAQPVRGMRAGPVAGGQRGLFVTGTAAGLLHALVYPGAAHKGGGERSAASHACMRPLARAGEWRRASTTGLKTGAACPHRCSALLDRRLRRLCLNLCLV